MATVQIEVAAVGLFSLFEARMQHLFPKGPFFKLLKTHLIDEGQPELANAVWHYYLAVNVLKHGRGASYETLLNEPDLPFCIKQPGDVFFEEGDISEPEGLINVTAAGFFEGLVQTLYRVHNFVLV